MPETGLCPLICEGTWPTVEIGATEHRLGHSVLPAHLARTEAQLNRMQARAAVRPPHPCMHIHEFLSSQRLMN